MQVDHRLKKQTKSHDLMFNSTFIRNYQQLQCKYDKSQVEKGKTCQENKSVISNWHIKYIPEQAKMSHLAIQFNR